MNQQIELPGFTKAGSDKFNKQVGKIVSNLNGRLRALKRPERMDLLSARLKLAPSVGKPCRYCGTILKIDELSGDHPIPIVRGGSPLVLEGICKRCNRRKGDLTDKEYDRVLAHIATHEREAQAYLFRVLSSGPAYFKMRAQVMGMRERLATQPATSSTQPAEGRG